MIVVYVLFITGCTPDVPYDLKEIEENKKGNVLSKTQILDSIKMVNFITSNERFEILPGNQKTEKNSKYFYKVKNYDDLLRFVDSIDYLTNNKEILPKTEESNKADSGNYIFNSNSGLTYAKYPKRVVLDDNIFNEKSSK